MINIIGHSGTNDYLSMRFALQPGTDFQNSCRMKCVIKTRNISPTPMNNSVPSCPPWRQNINESELHIKPKDLWTLRQIRTTMASMQAQKYHIRISQGLVS